MPHVRDEAGRRGQPRAELDNERHDAATGRPLLPTVARWPLDVDPGFAQSHVADPWEGLVRDSIVAYREGRTDVASWAWANDIVWRVAGHCPVSSDYRGPERIFDYHRSLVRSTGGAFSQRLVALESSGGPIVEAHVRTTARRGSRRLDIPSLVVFELGGSRIHTITEMPGDQDAWDRFWED